MTATGIIAEYNPFHTGHHWQTAQIHKALGGTTPIVVAMSGNWVQRGECAIADKWTRARWALSHGADLVLELPTPWAISSAEGFAQGGAAVLAATGVVDTLSFGSESGDSAKLSRVAKCLDSEAFSAALRPLLDQGLSFAACRQGAIASVLGHDEAACLSGANDNLGAEYLRAANAMGWSPDVLAIPRRGAQHDATLPAEGFASATILREWLTTGQSELANCFLPTQWPETLSPVTLDPLERTILARLRTMGREEFEALPDCGEGLSDRLAEAARQARSRDEVYSLTKSKRYAHARIRRIVLHALLGLTATDRPATLPYLRVLGFNPRGREVLHAMKQTATVPILTKPAQAQSLDEAGRRLFQLEARSTDLYGLCRQQIEPAGQEYFHSPVVL